MVGGLTSRSRRGQAVVSLAAISVILALIGIAYYMADQQLRAFELSVWDAVEKINKGVQSVYGLPERSVTISIYIPRDSVVWLKRGDGGNLVVEATGAFGDRRYRILEQDELALINVAGMTLTEDGKLTIPYGQGDRPVKLAGEEKALGPGRYTVIIRNLTGDTLFFKIIGRGGPPSVEEARKV